MRISFVTYVLTHNVTGRSAEIPDTDEPAVKRMLQVLVSDIGGRKKPDPEEILRRAMARGSVSTAHLTLTVVP